MKTDATGRTFIELFEGCERATADGQSYVPYYDSVGVLTQGFGHTNLGNVPPHVALGVAWSRAQCDAALSNDLAKFEARVDSLKLVLTQSQFNALVSFDFNTGDLLSSSIPQHIRDGDMTRAMATLLLYDHAAGRKLAGLTRRRHAERLLFLGEVETAMLLAGANRETAAEMAKAAMPVPEPPRLPPSWTGGAPQAEGVAAVIAENLPMSEKNG